jgi:hypothetical protein
MISWSIFGGYPAFHERGSRVPKIMNAEPNAQPGTGASWQEGCASPVGQPQDATAGHGEYEVISVLAGDGSCDLAGEEARNWDRA